MQAASRPYALAAAVVAATGAAVLAATGAVVALPLAPRPAQIPTRHIETRLVDDSVANIPINLFDDIMNIPYNEVQAVDTAADSLLDTGTWWVPSSTNVWGFGPWDITHVAAVDSFIPFPALDQGLGGLDYEIDGILAAEIPESASCDVATCAPIIPADPVTGITSVDHNIGLIEALDGQQPMQFIQDLFQVPLSELMSGYTFNAADDPGIVDPSGPAYEEIGFPLDGGSNPFEGPTGPGDTMPWDNLTYTLNPAQPFENFYESLLATPSTSGIDGTGIDIPTGTDLIYALQNITAGVIVDFDPFVPGSPQCAASCDIPTDLTVPSLVQDVLNVDPSNPTLQQWFTDLANGTAAEPTSSQIDETIALYQTGIFNLDATQLQTVDTDLADINPELPALYTNAGILTDPGYLAFTDATANTSTGPTTTVPFDPVYGGDNSDLVGQDFETLMTNNDWNFGALTESGPLLSLLDPALIVEDPGAYSAASTDPSSGASTLTSDAANLSALLGLTGASNISTDLTALLSQLSTELSTALSADLGTTLPTDLATTLPTDLGAILPTDLLTLF